jgi:hypothetical protein
MDELVLLEGGQGAVQIEEDGIVHAVISFWGSIPKNAGNGKENFRPYPLSPPALFYAAAIAAHSAPARPRAMVTAPKTLAVLSRTINLLKFAKIFEILFWKRGVFLRM